MGRRCCASNRVIGLIFYGLWPLTLKIARFHPARAIRLWPTATNVVALHPHQTKRKPTAVPSWISQPPHQNHLKSDNFATRSDPAFNFIFSQPRPYSKMLTLQIGHPWPPKASLTSCQAHAFFYKESSTSSSSELNLGMTNSFRTQKWLKTYLFIKVYADPIKFPAFNFV
jgi:hypothetical protein